MHHSLDVYLSGTQHLHFPVDAFFLSVLSRFASDARSLKVGSLYVVNELKRLE